jgi:hypothetical protein
VRLFTHPERVQAGQLLWLEIEEYPGLKIAVRVLRTIRGFRAEVEPIGSDHNLISVDYVRLFEEAPGL